MRTADFIAAAASTALQPKVEANQSGKLPSRPGDIRSNKLNIPEQRPMGWKPSLRHPNGTKSPGRMGGHLPGHPPDADAAPNGAG